MLRLDHSHDGDHNLCILEFLALSLEAQRHTGGPPRLCRAFLSTPLTHLVFKELLPRTLQAMRFHPLRRARDTEEVEASLLAVIPDSACRTLSAQAPPEPPHRLSHNLVRHYRCPKALAGGDTHTVDLPLCRATMSRVLCFPQPSPNQDSARACLIRHWSIRWNPLPLHLYSKDLPHLPIQGLNRETLRLADPDHVPALAFLRTSRLFRGHFRRSRPKAHFRPAGVTL